MSIVPYKKRIITDASTTTVLSESCVVFEIVIAIAAIGTTWTLQIQDKASSPCILVPKFTAALPTDFKPIIMNFNEPVTMDGGIDIITTGTHGEACIWLIVGKN